MKTINKIGAQGDVLFRKVSALPQNVKQQNKTSSIIVAHSETGHHHKIDASDVIHFEINDPLICYLRIDGDYADVVHYRDFDTHETLRLPKGIWEVRRQRQHTPQGWQRVVD